MNNYIEKSSRNMINPELLLSYCLGKCTPEEQQEIKEALESSEALRGDLQNLQLSLAIADDIKEIEVIDVNASFLRTRKKIRQERNKRIQLQWMRYAAFLSIPLLISTFILSYLNFFKPEAMTQYAEINTPMGIITRYELPDHSVVWLNSGTKLRHPTVFNSKERRVTLEGEAYFEVQADAKNPFYVDMPNGLSVYVYGTQFNINAYSDETFIETVLEKGKINVIFPDKRTNLVMHPGERLEYDKTSHTFEKSIIDVYEKTAWKDGKLIFRNTPIDDIFRKLSKHFNIDIEFHNHSGKEFRYRATFKNETIAQILDYLSKSARIKWKIEEQTQNADGTLSKEKITVELI